MATDKSTKVSPAFILKAYAVSCGEWKGKLEKTYPSVFTKGVLIKRGDKVKFPSSTSFSEAEYIISSAGEDRVTIVSMQDGNRWADVVKVGNVNHITLEEFKAMLGRKSVENVLLNGEPVLDVEVSKEKTLPASWRMIEEAYKAAPSPEIKEMVKAEFPEVFEKNYVCFGDKYDESNLTISTSSFNNVGGVGMFIGVGVVPDHLEYLRYSCIAVRESEVEDVEVIRANGKILIAFKRNMNPSKD